MPIDFGGMRSTGIMAIAYNKLKAHLGITDGETRLYDTGQQLALPEPPILDRFHVDVIDLLNTLGRFPEEWKDWTLPDGSPAKAPVGWNPVKVEDGWELRRPDGIVEARMPASCLYFESCYRPLADTETIADIERHDWSTVKSEDLWELKERAKWLYENTDYAIMFGFGGNILEGGQNAFGWERFMTEIALNTELVEYALDKMVEVYMEDLRVYLDAIGPYIQLIQMGDDLGTQTATMLSPEMYRKVVKPRHAKQYRFIREHPSDVHVFLHACGSCYDIMGDLVDEGVEALNPVQTSAVGMDPVRLKKEFGDYLAFWGGGCDTQSVLPNATPEEIDRHVRERIEIFAPGGGYVFNQIHNVQSNVPPENVVAMFDAAWKHGKYKNG